MQDDNYKVQKESAIDDMTLDEDFKKKLISKDD